eukprot:Gb_33114 [translate_table: standard]
MKISVGYHYSSISTVTMAALERIPTEKLEMGQLEETLRSLCNNGRLGEAMDVLELLDQRCISVGKNAYACLLQACIEMKVLAEGKRVHDHMAKSGFVPDTYLGNRLMDMYAKCGSVGYARQVFEKMSMRNVFSWNTMVATEAKCGKIEYARQMFDEMPERNVVSWNTIISAYTQNANGVEALNLFWQMKRSDVKPDEVTFASVIRAFASLTDRERGKQVHSVIIRTGFELNIFVGNALVDMYARCGSIENALQVFDTMNERDVVSWTSIVSGYVKCGNMENALQTFEKMPERNVVSWNVMIAGYTQNGFAEEALKRFWQMQQADVKPTLATFVSVLSACAGLAALETGKQVHAYMIRAGYDSNASAGVALIDMYAKSGSVENAHRLFHERPEHPVVLQNAMITGYFKCKSIEVAQLLFDRMLERDVVSWNAMIAGYAQSGYGEKALKLFSEMQLEDIECTQFSFVSVLNACASLATLKHGKQIHARILRNGFESNVFVGNSLIDMYAKCGSIEDARLFFNKMSEQDGVSWNVIIAGHAQNGHGRDALQLFEQMLRAGIRPDHITFIAILSACSYAGLVNEGYHYFESMIQDHFIKPRADHYTCMVDLLGRTGRLDEALNFINNIPFVPDASMWGALLGACRVHGNMELGEHVAECLFNLEPHNGARYVMLSDIYAAAGRWDDVAKVRKMIKDSGASKKPGCNWIEVEESVRVYTKFVLHDVECKEHVFWYHSKKLAIAFGLTSTMPCTSNKLSKALDMQCFPHWYKVHAQDCSVTMVVRMFIVCITFMSCCKLYAKSSMDHCVGFLATLKYFTHCEDALSSCGHH